MSLQRLKVAFNAAQRSAESRGVALVWDDFLAALIAEAPYTTLHTFVPDRMPNDERRQFELFAMTADGSVRELARAAGIPSSTAHDWLSERRTFFRTGT